MAHSSGITILFFRRETGNYDYNHFLPMIVIIILRPSPSIAKYVVICRVYTCLSLRGAGQHLEGVGAVLGRLREVGVLLVDLRHLLQQLHAAPAPPHPRVSHRSRVSAIAPRVSRRTR